MFEESSSSPSVRDNCYSRETHLHKENGDEENHPHQSWSDQLTCHRYTHSYSYHHHHLTCHPDCYLIRDPSLKRPTFGDQETREDHTSLISSNDHLRQRRMTTLPKMIKKTKKKMCSSITSEVDERRHIMLTGIPDSMESLESTYSVHDGNMMKVEERIRNKSLHFIQKSSKPSNYCYLASLILLCVIITTAQSNPMPPSSFSSPSSPSPSNQRSPRIVYSQIDSSLSSPSRRSRVGQEQDEDASHHREITQSAFYVNNSEAVDTSLLPSGHSRFPSSSEEDYSSTSTLRSTIHFPGQERTSYASSGDDTDNNKDDESTSTFSSSFLRTTRGPSNNVKSNTVLFPTTSSTTTLVNRGDYSEEGSSSLYPANVYTNSNNDKEYHFGNSNNNFETTVSESYGERFRNSVLLPDLDSSGQPVGCVLKPGHSFCESVDTYPELDLKKEVKLSMTQFREFFGSTSIDGRKSYGDDDSSEERVCGRIPKVIYPQMARNNANQWVYVVNDVEYIQAVVAEVCEKEGKPCAYLDHNLPDGMYSRCRQKYSYKKLLAIHPTEKRTYADTFQFPSCCACYIKAPAGFQARSRQDSSPSSRRRRK